MIEILVLIGLLGLLFYLWRRRRATSAAPPVQDTYVCPACDDTDCICEKDPAKESRSES